MLATYSREQLDSAASHDLSDALERGSIVHFPECPIELPSEKDLGFLRDEMPARLQLKNISYHPESDRLYGLKGDLVRRASGILKAHSARVQAFLKKTIPALTGHWKVGTSSFRPLQERGRNLESHASNELVHVDAGAYGATHGDRIIRFFVNVNPAEDRVWVTKGAFPDLYRRYGAVAGIQPSNGGNGYLEESVLDRLRTGALGALGSIMPSARLLDSSPYDRVMRRFHNYMKDTPEFQNAEEGHREFRFKPFSSWMVFTDMVSHACISGQHALVDTFVIPLADCRLQEMAPINILKRPISES